jgi:hypothetical protein
VHRYSSWKIVSGSICEHLQSKRSRQSCVGVAPPGLLQGERARAGRSLAKRAINSVDPIGSLFLGPEIWTVAELAVMVKHFELRLQFLVLGI